MNWNVSFFSFYLGAAVYSQFFSGLSLLSQSFGCHFNLLLGLTCTYLVVYISIRIICSQRHAFIFNASAISHSTYVCMCSVTFYPPRHAYPHVGASVGNC